MGYQKVFQEINMLFEAVLVLDSISKTSKENEQYITPIQLHLNNVAKWWVEDIYNNLKNYKNLPDDNIVQSLDKAILYLNENNTSVSVYFGQNYNLQDTKNSLLEYINSKELFISNFNTVEDCHAVFMANFADILEAS